MIKQILSAVEVGLGCRSGGYTEGSFLFFKMTSKVHEKLDSEGSLPIACAGNLSALRY